MLCIATGLFGLFFFLTLFMQTVLGYSAIRSGIAYLPFAVGVVIASALASRLVARIGAAAADPGRRRRGRGRDVLVFPADRARRLRRPAARPDAGDLVRARPGVRPAVPGRPAQRGRAGLRCRLEPAQHRPAGRRRDRAGAARHHRLDAPSPTASGPVAQRGHREGGPAIARSRARPPQSITATPWRPAFPVGSSSPPGSHCSPCSSRSPPSGSAARNWPVRARAARGGAAARDCAAARGPSRPRRGSPSLPALLADTSSDISGPPGLDNHRNPVMASHCPEVILHSP